jgi:hypothetical protein
MHGSTIPAPRRFAITCEVIDRGRLPRHDAGINHYGETAMNLRLVLWIDAATCAATGLLLSALAAKLSALLGLPAPLLLVAGLSLFPIAAFMAWAAKRPSPPAVWLVIGGNALWVLGSLLVLALSPTTLGIVFVIAQAAAVALLAELEYAALRRS